MLSNPITEAGQSQLVTEVDAAKLLCQSIRTLQKWRVTGYGPAHYKIGRNVRYRLNELNTWIDSRRRSHTSQGEGH
jgi:hypothetical protein